MICISDRDRLVELVQAFQYEAQAHGGTHVKEVREYDAALLVHEGATALEQPRNDPRLRCVNIYYRGCAFRHAFVVSEEAASAPPSA
jgi:hypothetical protein